MNNWFIYNKSISSLKPLGLSDEILQIMANRGIGSIEEALCYLNPSVQNLHDPFSMADMDSAVDLLIQTIEEDGHIHIVGDYDQDGNSATVTLIKGIGAFHRRLTYAIPDRIEDGYGINTSMVENAIKMKVDLIITCDNGISAHEAVSYAVKNGIRVIVTDHHQVSTDDKGTQILPEADAVLNPNRQDCPYPFKHLCGAGVAFKLVTALYDALGGDYEDLLGLLQFVAMGTVCDVVELQGENRAIVHEGLQRINTTDNPGLKALIRLNNWNKPVDVYALGFVLGPCINASGRLSTARLGIELFLEQDETLVDQYAIELIRLNNERKLLTETALKSATGMIEETGAVNDDVIVAYTDEGHESIVGIVAGRIKDRYYRPCLVFTNAAKEGFLKGSGRSIEEYHMYEKLSEAKGLMESFGGHKMAAGFTIKSELLDKLRAYLNQNSELTEADLIRKYTIDVAYPIDRLSEGFIETLQILEPFGVGNPKPVMADKAIDLLTYKVMGKNQNVLKLILLKNGSIVEAISFSDIDTKIAYLIEKFGEENLNNYSPNRTKPNLIDMIYYPKVNEFRGERSVQLQIIDIR